ncbi:MAG: flavin reductase family protein [Candidatus Pacearchaeota archaeon]
MEIKKSFQGGVVPGPHQVTLITSGDTNPNIMAVSYVGQLTDNIFYISVRSSRYTNNLIKQHRLFGINFMETKHFKETDFCGMVSGRHVDKSKISGLTIESSEYGIPLIKESPLSIECELVDTIHLGAHDIFIGRVLCTRRRKKNPDWLFHDEFEYFGKKGILGNLFDAGKEMLRNS